MIWAIIIIIAHILLLYFKKRGDYYLSKKAAIYIRVSTDFQAEEGYSIEAQKEQLTAYCVAKGIRNYEYFIDGGWSGSNIQRPEIQRLIKESKEGMISHCIVYKLDRLSRSQKDTLYLIEDVFNPNGVNFISINESMDTSTPMGKLMLGILSAFAKLERENIRMRTRMGMKERVKNGYWMGGGKVPFGYDYDRELGILVPNKDAEKVKVIYDMYLQGYSPQAIATATGLKYDRLVYQILTRKTNCGYIVYNGEEYKGRHEAIIDEDTYNRTMQVIESRSINRRVETVHLLTGLVYCGKCGAKMAYKKWGKAGYKFMCYSQEKSKLYLVKDKNCNQDKIWADEGEEIGIKDLFAFSLKLTESSKNKKDEFDTSPLDMLTKEGQDIQRKIKKLYNLYADSEDDLLLDTINEFKTQYKKIENQINKLREGKNIYNKQEHILDSITNLSQVWDYLSGKEKQNIVHLLIKKIVLTNNNVSIEYSI